MLRPNREVHCLHRWHSICVPGEVPVASLPIQLPANVTGTASEEGWSTWIPVPTWKTSKKLLAPGFTSDQISSRCCNHLRSETPNKRTLFLSVCLSVFLSLFLSPSLCNYLSNEYILLKKKPLQMVFSNFKYSILCHSNLWYLILI